MRGLANAAVEGLVLCDGDTVTTVNDSFAILADSAYLLGDRFTVADLNAASVLSASRLSAINMASFPHVADWAKRCQGRPAALAVQAMREAGL